MNEDIVTLILGDEYDNKLRDVLRNVLVRNNATLLDKSWGVVGSQELELIVVILHGEKITIESETFVGLTVTGPKKIVEDLASQVSGELF